MCMSGMRRREDGRGVHDETGILSDVVKMLLNLAFLQRLERIL